MGTQMAPSYMNIYMDDLEKPMLASIKKIHVPSIWQRYIDDIFSIWPYGGERLKTFLKAINEFHPSIKFTPEWSPKSVSFLDTKISLDIEGRLPPIYMSSRQTLISISTGTVATLATVRKAIHTARCSGSTKFALEWRTSCRKHRNLGFF